MSRPLHEWRFEVGAPDHGNRLDAFLGARLSWRSRQGVQAAIRERRVEVLPNKDPQSARVGRLRPSLRLRVGQEVAVELPAPQAEVGATEEGLEPATLVFEDEYLVAVDKPPHRSVYPSRRHRAGSLIEWVHRRHRERNGPAGYFPTPCHRLDRETSGLVLFAKTREVRVELSRQFEERLIRKVYLAVVHGQPCRESGLIEAALGRESSSAVGMRVGVVPGGRPATTAWRLVRTCGEMSLLQLEPKTGRRHQLRAHLASIGHPIVGDKLYCGGDSLFLRSLEGDLTDLDRAQLGLERQALHAWQLELNLGPGKAGPRGEVRLEAPLADDIVDLLSERAPVEERCADRALAS